MPEHSRIAYGVPGIDQKGARLIQKRLRALAGVHDVTVWLGQQQIEVDYDPALVGPQALVDAMTRLGYVVQFVNRPERWPG